MINFIRHIIAFLKSLFVITKPVKTDSPCIDPVIERKVLLDTLKSDIVNIERSSRFVWCIDAGHGIDTPGKRSPVISSRFMSKDIETRLFEFDFNRDIVNIIAYELDRLNIDYMIVTPEINDIRLRERVRRINSFKSDKQKITISVHGNAGKTRSNKDWTTANGVEVWYFEGSPKSKRLASVFQKHIVSATGLKNREIKPTRKLYILKRTQCPAILTENAFFNNKKEAREMMKPSFRNKVAQAHINAILEVENNGI